MRRLSALLVAPALLLGPAAARADGLAPAGPATQGQCYASGTSGPRVPCVLQGQTWTRVQRPTDDASGMSVLGRSLMARGQDQTNVKDAPYGARGDGTTDDRAALAAADAAGATVIPPGTYRIASSVTLGNDVTFMPGAVLLPDAGVTVTLAGQIDAARKQYIFKGAGTVVAAGAHEVWTSWWGAFANRTTDAAPAFRAAMGSARTVRSIPATYRFCSWVMAGPYAQDAAHTTGQYFPAGVWPMGYDDLTVDNTGATFNTCDYPNPLAIFFFDRNKRAHLTGGTYNGNHNLIADIASSVAVVTHNQDNSLFENFTVGGNFGGGGSGMASNWTYNTTYRNIRMTGVGQAVDFAQAKGLTIDGMVAVGGDATQSGGPGSKGVSFIYDPVGTYDSRLPYNFDDNDGVTIVNSEFSNFTACLYVFSGKNYRISNNRFHNCTGNSGGAQGVGALIGWSSASAGRPVQNFIMDNNIIDDNGAVNGNAGVVVGNGAITNSDVMSGIKITNNIIKNNRDTGIRATGTSNLANIDFITGNKFIPGSNQLYALGGYVSALQDPPPVLSSCGTSPSVQAGSANRSGVVTLGTGATGCTITFARPAPTYPQLPICNVMPASGATASSWSVANAGGVAVLTLSNASPGTYGYQCSGN